MAGRKQAGQEEQRNSFVGRHPTDEGTWGASKDGAETVAPWAVFGGSQTELSTSPKI